jgi:hypothetical protein
LRNADGDVEGLRRACCVGVREPHRWMPASWACAYGDSREEVACVGCASSPSAHRALPRNICRKAPGLDRDPKSGSLRKIATGIVTPFWQHAHGAYGFLLV